MPSDERVERAVELLKRGANYEYFFEQLRSADWVRPLRQRGLFSDPPEPVARGEYVSLPFWPASRYLARVAADAPSEVLEALQGIPPTENTRVHEDIVEAACELPTSLAATLVPSITTFIENPYELLLAENVGRLIVRLAGGGELPSALALAEAILAPVEGVQSFLTSDPEPKFRFPEYQEVLASVILAIAETDSTQAFGLTIQLLDGALMISNPDSRSEDFSYLWRPQIDARASGAARNDVRDALVETVCRLLPQTDVPVGQALDQLEALQWPVMQRIALSFLAQRADEYPELARPRVLQTERLFEPSQRREYLQLLRATAPSLSTSEFGSVLHAIETGPNPWEDEAEGDHAVRSAVLAVRTLRVLEDKLPPEGVTLLNELSSGLDHPVPAEDEIESDSSAVFVGPKSPVSVDELLAMPDEDLVEFLRAWEPEDGWHLPTADGLALTLTSAVEEEPLRLSGLAPSMVGLPAAYVSGALRGWRNSRRTSHNALNSGAVLELCRWVVEQEDTEPASTQHPRWEWARREVADLLSTLLQAAPSELPIEYQPTVWDLLMVLVSDSDPTPESETAYSDLPGGAVALGINAVRGQALRAIVYYGLWLHRHATLESDQPRSDEMFELWAVLDAHLDDSREHSLGVRSAYAQLFPWLHLLSEEWATENLDKIFPRYEPAVFDTMWDAYVMYTQPLDDMAAVMRPIYEFAVDRISTDTPDGAAPTQSQNQLSEHLAVFIARGVIDVEDPMVRSFFAVSPPSLAAHLLWFLGHDLDKMLPDAFERCKSLWVQRLRRYQVAEADDRSELRAFGFWFLSAALSMEWRVSNLLAVLELSDGRVSVAYSVLERLADEADQMPSESVEIVRLMSREHRDESDLPASTTHISRVLAAGLAADEPAVRDAAESLVHDLGAKGFGHLRSLLVPPGSAPESSV